MLIIIVGNHRQFKGPNLWYGKIEDIKKCALIQSSKCAFKEYLKTVDVKDLSVYRYIEDRWQYTSLLIFTSVSCELLVNYFLIFLFGLVSTFGEAGRSLARALKTLLLTRLVACPVRAVGSQVPRPGDERGGVGANGEQSGPAVAVLLLALDRPHGRHWQACEKGRV